LGLQEETISLSKVIDLKTLFTPLGLIALFNISTKFKKQIGTYLQYKMYL